MVAFFMALITWLPPVIQVVCIGVIAIFFIFTILHIIRFILDLIPFL